MGDLYNRKTMFLASIAVFLGASALCGTASTMNELIIFRALQGVGAGGLGAGAFALIGALLPPRERGRYQGMVAIVMAVGSIGGPLAGGVITGHLGWRWAFYLNLPIGLICIAWCQLLLHLPHTRCGKVVIDWLGITLMTAMVSTIVSAVMADHSFQNGAARGRAVTRSAGRRPLCFPRGGCCFPVVASGPARPRGTRGWSRYA
ncbi:MFS transporter [Streptomyces sp. CG4]|uniref:MFS transporter n=1 Tax=Streptomyces sp. CG4 TaxID=408783 RepID=UPI0034E26705